jgi:tetratricopeptide (TPR) repeat protein
VLAMTKAKLICSLSLACFALLAAAPAFALDETTQQSDFGAGKVDIRVTKCLMAVRSHVGLPCPEPAVSRSDDKAERVASHVARAWYFIDMQQLEKARAEVDLALASDPDNAKVRHFAARISWTLTDLPRAEADLEQALKQAPDDADIRTTHALMWQTKQASYQSLRELEDIIHDHPDQLYAREQAALLCMKFGYYEVALANLDFVLEHRVTAKLLSERADVFLALGKRLSAAADFSAILEREPDNVFFLKRRANTYAQAEMYDLAVRDYNALLATDQGAPIHVMFPDERAKLLMNRAFSDVKLRRFDAAASDAITAMSVGGVQAILRAQLLLRRSGFADVAVDGQDSPTLRRALAACFGLSACFQEVMKSI